MQCSVVSGQCRFSVISVTAPACKDTGRHRQGKVKMFVRAGQVSIDETFIYFYVFIGQEK